MVRRGHLRALPRNEKATVASHATHASDTFTISLYSIFLFSRVKSKKTSVASVASSHLEHGTCTDSFVSPPEGRGRVTQPLDGELSLVTWTWFFPGPPHQVLPGPTFPSVGDQLLRIDTGAYRSM
jgi:hypothetical protein